MALFNPFKKTQPTVDKDLLSQLKVRGLLKYDTSGQAIVTPEAVRNKPQVRQSLNIPTVRKYQSKVRAPQVSQEKPSFFQRFKQTVTQPKVEIPQIKVDTFLYKRLKDNGLDDKSIADKLGVSERLLPNRQKTASAKFLDEQLGKVFKFQPGEILPRLDLPDKKGTRKTITGKEISKDANRRQFEALINTPIRIIDDVVKSLSKTEKVLGDKDARTSEKVAAYLEVPLNSARMIPGWAKFETLLNIAGENPITENLANVISTGFEYLGKAGSPIGAKFISVLPISDEAKEDLTPIAEDIGGFTTQFLTLIALHKGVSRGKDIKIKTGADVVLEWKDIRDITIGKKVEPKKLDAYKKLTKEGVDFTEGLKQGKGKIKVGGATETVGEYVMRKAKDMKGKVGLSIEDVSKREIKPLEKEARKYKSADEFVKAQPKVYHGTDAKFDEFDVSKSGTSFNLSEGGIFFVKEKDTANAFASLLKGDEKRVVEGYIQAKKPKIIDLKNEVFYPIENNKIIAEAKKAGNDVVIFKNVKGSDSYKTDYTVVIDNNAVKTKSQLTDIYNQAHEVKPIVSKSKIVKKPVLATEKDITREIDKRVDKFRKEADLMAKKAEAGEGAGVRRRNVLDAVGNVEWVAKSFKLARAKGDMKRQADDMKAYAKEMLYENDPDFKELVDKRDAVMENQIDTSSDIDMLEAFGEDLKKDIIKLETYEQTKTITTKETPAKTTKQIKEIKEPINKVALTESEVDVVQSYEFLKDRWLGKKDVDVLKAQVEKNSLQDSIKKALGKKKYDQEAKDADSAIQIYLDTKRNPEDYAAFYSKLTPEQQRIADISQNLDPKLQKIADKIDESYREIGLEAMDADIIKNVLDNYVARVWDIENKSPTESFRKFGQTTRHAKARTFGTILEGQAAGMDLKVQGATSNLEILKTEIKNTIADKKFIRSLGELRTVDGQSFLTDKQLDGYVPIEHPSFTSWKFAGNAVEGEVYGKNFFVTPDGILMERRKLFAPKAQAKNLNNILGASKLKGLPGVDTLTKYNAIAKSWILQSSFFHHLAFTRSYFLGTNHKQFKEMSLNQAYKTGLQSIKNLEPDILLGVENGLTLGLKQDWEESLLQEKTIIGEVLDKTKATKAVKDKILKLRQAQADFLFGEFGSGLKAKAFLIEYRNLLKKNPNMPTKKAATMAANLINDDFGGLHLKRLGRNPTVQHVFRLFALAPDWTESNIRSMVKAVGAGEKAERAMYRKFWAGIMTKGILLTVLANLLMVGGNIDDLIENYKKAWKTGKFRWLDVDVTNIYKLFGGETQEHKYFSILGHFKDVLKFSRHPIKSLQHKGSVVYRIFHEALVGTNYAGQQFTTYKELLENKETVKFGSSSPIEFGQVPSYLISQIKGTQPVQIQNLINWMLGEMEGFDAMGNSLGLGVATTYSANETPKKQKAAFFKELKKQLDKGIITKDIAQAEMAKKIKEIDKAAIKDFKDNIGSLTKEDTHTRLKEFISEGVIDQAGAEKIMASKIKAVDTAKKETESAERAREEGVLKKTEEESIFRTIERGAKALGVDFPTALKAIFTKEKIDVVTKQRVGLERLEMAVTEAFEREHVAAKDKKKFSVEHWIPRSIGGKNYPDSGNLRIIPTALHDEFTPLENAILKAVENNTISPGKARKIIKDYKDKRFKEYEEDKQIKEAPDLDTLL
jgi:hypothetical protein